MLWVLLALVVAGAGEASAPSDEAVFEAQTLQLQGELHGYGVLRGDDQLSAQQFASLVGDSRGLKRVALSRRRLHARAATSMGVSAVMIGAGSWLMAAGLARNTGDQRGEGPVGQMAAGGAVTLGGVGLYAVTATMLMGRGPRVERVDRYYSPDEARAWMVRYHDDLAAQLGVAAEAPR